MNAKKFLSVTWIAFLIFCLIAGSIFPAFAETASASSLPDCNVAKSVYLYNFDSDTKIVSKNENQKIAPASTVKILLGLLAIERFSNRLDQSVTLSADMLSSNAQGTSLNLQVGDVLTIRDLLYGTVCGGYNDAANALAVLHSGSLSSYVAYANDVLASWGCRDTHYTNATGMDETGMYTTLHDVVILSERAIESPLYMEISSANSYVISLQNREYTATVYNRNSLISPYYYQGCQSKYAKGIIAGMTDSGGYCVSTYAEYHGSRYLCIVMGAGGMNSDVPNSFHLAFRLLQYAYLNCAYTPVATKGTSFEKIPVELVASDSKDGVAYASCVLDRDLYALLPEEMDASKLEFRSFLHTESICAPISAGSVVGGIDVYYQDRWVCHGKLIVDEDIQPNAMLYTLNAAKNLFLSRRVGVALLIFVPLLLAYLYWEYRKQQKTRRQTLPYRQNHRK